LQTLTRLQPELVAAQRFWQEQVAAGDAAHFLLCPSDIATLGKNS
jgi:hypothetical protein